MFFEVSEFVLVWIKSSNFKIGWLGWNEGKRDLKQRLDIGSPATWKLMGRAMA